MTGCFVPDCNHRSGVNKCSFHHFPKTTSVRSRWIQNIRRGDSKPTQHSRVCSCHFTKGLQKGPIWFPSRVKGIPPVEEDTEEEDQDEEDSPRVEHQAASGGVDCPASGAQQQDQRMVVVHQDQGPATGQLQVIPQGVTVIPSPGQQIMEVTLPNGQTQSCLFSPVAQASSTAATTIDDAGRPHSATRTPARPARLAPAAPVHPTDPLQCVQCCITFSDAKGKMRHTRKSHREEYNQQLEQQGDTIFSCYVCELSFPSSEELCTHQHTHSREDKRYKCDSCSEGFYFLSELTTHRRQVCRFIRRRPRKIALPRGRPKKITPSALPQEPSALPQEPSALPQGH